MITLLKDFNDKQCNTCIHRSVCAKKVTYGSFKNTINGYGDFIRTYNLYIECKDYYDANNIKNISGVADDGESRMG